MIIISTDRGHQITMESVSHPISVGDTIYIDDRHFVVGSMYHTVIGGVMRTNISAILYNPLELEE